MINTKILNIYQKENPLFGSEGCSRTDFYTCTVFIGGEYKDMKLFLKNKIYNCKDFAQFF